MIKGGKEREKVREGKRHSNKKEVILVDEDDRREAVGIAFFCICLIGMALFFGQIGESAEKQSQADSQMNKVILDISEFVTINGTKIYYLGFVSGISSKYVCPGIETPDGIIECRVPNEYKLKIGNGTVKVSRDWKSGGLRINSTVVKYNEFTVINGIKMYNLGEFDDWLPEVHVFIGFVSGSGILELKLYDNLFSASQGPVTIGNATVRWAWDFKTDRLVIMWK